VDPLRNEPNGIGTNQCDRNDQDARKGDVKNDLEAVKQITGASNDGVHSWAEGVIRW
jgi:hypothetical protein